MPKTKTIQSIQNNVLAGVLFLFPLYALLILLGKVFFVFFRFGKMLTEKLGLHSLLGATGASILVLVLLVFVFYLAGLLVRFKVFAQWRNKLDDLLAFWLPPYRVYREMALRKIAGDKELLPYQAACWLKVDGDCLQPAFVMETYPDNRCLVFVPTAGNASEGNLMVCPPNKLILDQDHALKDFQRAYDAMGLGLPTPPPAEA